MSVLCSLIALLVLLFGGGRLLYEQYYGNQDCEMTWMYQWPQYLEVPMGDSIQSSYPQYGLYLYTEGDKKEGGVTVLAHSLSGVPVLFIPGNAGSHRQARSSASIALRMHGAEFPRLLHFDFFTVKLNEELSGLFGGVLQRQAKYVSLCVNHILSLYSHLPTPPRSIVIIAHSMGGVVAHSLFTQDHFNSSTVHTIIAMASPLLRPVISFDSLLQGFYERQKGANMDHVSIVSIAGGMRDIMVPSSLTPSPQAINLATPAIPRNWASADHRAIVWCRRVQLALIRSLFLLQNPVNQELIRDKTQRDATFAHLLLKGREIPQEVMPTFKVIKQSLVTIVNGSCEEGIVSYSLKGNSRGEYFGVELMGHTPIHVTSNTGQSSWIFVCDQTLNCSDVSSRAFLLPPKLGVVKSISMLPTDYGEGNSLLVIRRPSKPHPKAASKGFLTIHQCGAHEQLRISMWGTTLTLPHPHCSFINFSLLDFKEIWQTYNAVISSPCGEVQAKLSTPWYPHTPPTHSRHHNVSLSLSLQMPTPSNYTPHLLIWSPTDCPLTVQITPDPLELLDKLFVLYTPLLLPWVTAVCVSGQQWSLGVELLAITALYGFSSIKTLCIDWQILSSAHLWGGFAPLVIHLIARGIAMLLNFIVRLVVVVTRKIFGCGSFLGWMWIILSVPGVMVCSGVGAICLLIGWTFVTVSSSGCVYMLSVLVCLNVFTLPTVGSWIKGFSVQPLLSPDPHFVGILATICIATVLVWRPSGSVGSLKRYWAPLLAMSLLCYSTVHMYRTVWFVVLFMAISFLEQLVLSLLYS